MKTTPFVQPWKTLKQSCKTHTHRTQSAATATLSAQAQLRPSGGSDLETALLPSALAPAPGPQEGGPGPTRLPCAPTSGTGTAVSPLPVPTPPPPQDTGQQAAWARFLGLPPRPESTPGRGSPPDGRGVAVSWDGSLAGDTARKTTTHLQAHEGVLGLTADSQEGKEERRAHSVEKAGLPDVGKFPRESQPSGQVTRSFTACQLCLRRAVSSLLSPVSPPMAHLGSTTQQ